MMVKKVIFPAQWPVWEATFYSILIYLQDGFGLEGAERYPLYEVHEEKKTTISTVVADTQTRKTEIQAWCDEASFGFGMSGVPEECREFY